MPETIKKPTVESLAGEVELLKKKVDYNSRDIHHLQTESATKKIVLDGMAGDDKTRAERIELAKKFFHHHYPALKVDVVSAFRLQKKGNKPGKMICTLESSDHVTEILHLTKPRNPPNGRDGVFVGPELSRLAQESQYKKRVEKRSSKK